MLPSPQKERRIMIKRLKLQGSAKEVGIYHGSKGKDQVLQSLETYENLFHGYQKISWKEARERALTHLKAIEAYDPEMIEEMEGIAIGAGVEFEDILALNARSEIALAGYKGTAFSDGCTAIAVMPPAGSETILGQNWDWKGPQKKSLLMLDIHQAKKPAIQMVTEGGIIGKIGFNANGVGVCFNALITDKKSDALPIHLGLRAVLNSYSLPEAISKVKEDQLASAASFLIGSDDGNGNGLAVNGEVSPFGMDLVPGNNGTLVHTNHICSDTVKESLKDMNEFRQDDSILRKMRAEQLIQTAKIQNRALDEKAFKEWLSDEFNKPNSINHYPNHLAPEHRQMETIFSIIMNLTKRKMFLCVGKPSEGEFEEII